MYENNPAYQDYPEVTPDAASIEEPTDHKKAVATAVGGSVVLGASAYGLSLLGDDSSSSEAAVADDASPLAAAEAADARAKASLPIVPVAMSDESGLNKLNWPLDRLDELTFDEAFAAARHQMGPAHHFNWHVGKPEGGLFNTFFQQEEADLTKAERAAFIATLPGAKESASTNEPASPTQEVHPSGGGGHHRAPSASPEAQLAVADTALAEQPVSAEVTPVITVIPLAAIAGHEVTPLADTHTMAAIPPDQSMTDHTVSPMHSDSMAGGSIESVDQHASADHDAHGDHGTDQHDFGQ